MLEWILLPLLSLVALVGYYYVGNRSFFLLFFYMALAPVVMGVMKFLASPYPQESTASLYWFGLCFPGWLQLGLEGAGLMWRKWPLWRQQRKLRQVLHAFVEARGLKVSSMQGTRLVTDGAEGAIEVAFQTTSSGPALTITWVSDTLPEKLSFYTTDAEYEPFGALSPAFFLRDGVVPAFDNIYEWGAEHSMEPEASYLWTGLRGVALRGHEACVMALFSPQTCELFESLMGSECPAEICMSEQVIELRWPLSSDLSFLSSSLTQGQALFAALRVGEHAEELPQRLLARAQAPLPSPVTSDIVPFGSLAQLDEWLSWRPFASRIRCLELLLELFPKSEAAQQAMLWASQHELMAFRLLALFKEGQLPSLRSLWQERRPYLSVDDPYTQMVVREYVAHAPKEDALAFVAEVAAAGSPSALLLALQVAQRRALTGILPHLVPLLSLMSTWRASKEAPVEPVVVNGWLMVYLQTIGVLGHEALWVEEGLEVSLLGSLRAPLDDASRMLLRLLSSWGTSDAIPTLYTLGERLSEPVQREECEQAIMHVRYRMGQVEAGQLSVVVPTENEGQLSLSNDPDAGQLSLSSDPGTGQLSLNAQVGLSLREPTRGNES